MSRRPLHNGATTPQKGAGHRKIQWLLFAATFLSFAYFHQGSGWNQNARFALVRAIVEERTFAIDSYLVYAVEGTEQGARLVRAPVRNAEFTFEGRRFAFHWRDEQGRPVRLSREGVSGGDGATYVEPEQVACTGDVSFFNGRFHPAKAPGGSFAAVPAYFVLYHLGRLAGVDPDDPWILARNAWLTSALSVGLLSALGCVLLYRLALELSGGRAQESLLVSLTFAFGTLFFPYGTALYEHNVIAVALLAAFCLLHRVRAAGRPPAQPLAEHRARLLVCLAGLCAGYAAITNYLMLGVVIILGCFLLFGVRLRGGWLWFGLGLLGPFLLICAYNMACFSTPFTTNYRYESPVFKAGAGAFLDVFVQPQWSPLISSLVSPYRGLFFGSPALLLGVYGWSVLRREGRWTAEALLFACIFVFLLLFLLTFNGWHGGWAVGPRYLVPGLPFLGVMMVFGFVRFFKTSCLLAAVSVVINLLVTAVDPQAPVGNARSALVPGRPQWLQSPITDYVLPLFIEGRAGPLLRAQRDEVLRSYDETLQAGGEQAMARALQVGELKSEIDAAILAGHPAPLLLSRNSDGQVGVSLSESSTIAGPVSVNPIGVYEGWMYRAFPPHSSEANWNSFNAGEFLFERSRWSLLPLLLAMGLTAFAAVRAATRLDAMRSGEGGLPASVDALGRPEGFGTPSGGPTPGDGY